MFPSFSVRASFMQEHGNSCFWCNFSVAINSARCVQHCTSVCHPVQLKHTCPDLKSLNGLLPTVWAMRSKRDVLPSPIVPLPVAPFFSFGYTFQVSFSMFADQQGNQNAGSITGWTPRLLHAAKSEPDYASIRTGMKVQAGRHYMPFFGLCRPRAFCVGATNHLQRLPCDTIGSCCWQPSPDTIIQTQPMP